VADRAEAPAPIPPTPRSQLARVVVGASLAAVLGAGPAVAWDVSTQLPRAPPPSHWPKPSPWRDAGKNMKTAAGDIARLYLPRTRPAPAASEVSAATPAPTPTPSVTTASPATARRMPYVVSIPRTPTTY
jgi:hypothetical protein